jgi:hypothetical protein
MRHSATLSATAALLIAAHSAGAMAQTTQAAPPSSKYLLTAPLYAPETTDPYALTTATLQAGSGGTSATTSAAPPPAYSFEEFARNIHGYVSAGVSTQSGHDFSGGVFVPLVPGKVDLAVSGSTGQQGGFVPLIPGNKPGIAHYDTYNVGLYLHPTDDISAYIGVAGGSFKLPYPYASPYYPGGVWGGPWQH